MATDLTTTDPADGRRALAWKALSLLPSTTDRVVEQLGDEAPSAIEAAIEKTEHDLRPVPAGEGRKQWEIALDERVRRLAAKVAPTASEAQTAAWRDAMVAALSDLPAMVSLTAAKRAIHRPFRFIADIEAVVREIAEEIESEYRGRLALLKRMLAEIERASAPAVVLIDVEEREYRDDEIRAMSPDIRALGIAAGAMTRAQVDAALDAVSVQSKEAKAA